MSQLLPFAKSAIIFLVASVFLKVPGHFVLRIPTTQHPLAFLGFLLSLLRFWHVEDFLLVVLLLISNWFSALWTLGLFLLNFVLLVSVCSSTAHLVHVLYCTSITNSGTPHLVIPTKHSSFTRHVYILPARASAVRNPSHNVTHLVCHRHVQQELLQPVHFDEDFNHLPIHPGLLHPCSPFHLRPDFLDLLILLSLLNLSILLNLLNLQNLLNPLKLSILLNILNLFLLPFFLSFFSLSCRPFLSPESLISSF